MDKSEAAKRVVREQQRRVSGSSLREAAKTRQEGRQIADSNSRSVRGPSEKLNDTLIRMSPEAFERQRILSGRPLTAIERSKVDEARKRLQPKRSAVQEAAGRVQSESMPQTDHDVEVELERRQSEAARDWRRRSDARAEFGQTVGKEEHKDWQAELRRSEGARGRVEGRDYAIEYTLAHPDGGNVRYDYVDFKNHLIVDRKAQAADETDFELIKTYKEQQERHIEAYKARFGRIPTYEYSPYPSTRELFRFEE